MAGKKLSASILALIIIKSISVAQPSLQKMQQKLSASKQNTAQSFYRFDVISKMKNQGSILFSPDLTVQKNYLLPWLADKLALRQGRDVFLQSGQPSIYAGSQVSKLKQYFKGIKVEHGVILLVDVDSKVRLLQMEFYSVPGNLEIVPAITEAAAMEKALLHVNAEKYVWEEYTGIDVDYAFPKGELVIIEDSYQDIGKLCLAYKFNIFASKPLGRNHVYLNAVDGKVVSVDAVIKHLDNNNEGKSVGKAASFQKRSSFLLPPARPATAEDKVQIKTRDNKPLFDLASGYTKYSGDQFFSTQQVAPDKYRLWGATSANSTPYFVLNSDHLLIPIPDASLTDFYRRQQCMGRSKLHRRHYLCGTGYSVGRRRGIELLVANTQQEKL